ncbi:IS256 family transposase [Stygiobacter electus]|uniref:Mutator family transposase n=1 Tax=Stygiobacter electus TaxID=3032292 RepID=A0AAE3P4S8_9BACT|nr:transposase [Stygiobacter electus]MDF1613328.1 transposase [Stygiobacter electus]
MKNSKISKENLEWYLSQPTELQLGLFENFVEMAKLHYNQMMEKESVDKAGEKYERGKRYNRWGSNPGSIRIGEEKVPVDVPRYYDKEEMRTEESETYKNLHEIPMPSEVIMKKIIKGLSQRDYEEVTKSIFESFGMSQSTISRTFIEESKKLLEEFEKRDLGIYDFAALIIDGKYLSHDNIVIALGVTMTGVKVPLGFIQTTTENSQAVKGLLKNLIERNFHFEEGLLTIIDGSKGLRKAVEETFGNLTLIQRCQWHKRENVVSYLRQEEKEVYRGKLQRAYSEPDYDTAKGRLFEIRDELRKINRTASNSLEEGLEETLTMHRLGLIETLGASFTTTNLIENLNSQLTKYIRKVKRWTNSEMKSRWVAVALLEIEKKMRRVNRFDKLNLLRVALKSELRLNQQNVA